MTAPVITDHEADQIADLCEALDIIRQVRPDAAQVYLDVVDTPGYGFGIVDLILRDGRRLKAAEGDEAIALIEDAVWPRLAELDHDGIVGENKKGCATINL